MAVASAFPSFSVFRFWTSRARQQPRLLNICARPASAQQVINIHGSQASSCLWRAHYVVASTRQRHASHTTLPATKCVLVQSMGAAPRNSAHMRHYDQAHRKQINLQNHRYYAQDPKAEAKKRQKSEYDRAYRLANPERIKARVVAWQLANREKVTTYARTWKKENPDKWAEIHKRSLEKHEAKVRVRHKRIVHCKECNYACGITSMQSHAERTGHRISDKHTHRCHECKRWYAARAYLIRHGNLKGHAIDPETTPEQED
jgi:hypothetical protein